MTSFLRLLYFISNKTDKSSKSC